MVYFLALHPENVQVFLRVYVPLVNGLEQHLVASFGSGFIGDGTGGGTDPKARGADGLLRNSMFDKPVDFPVYRFKFVEPE